MEEEFISWEILLKKVRRSLTTEEEVRFRSWLAEDASHQEYYERMRKVWSADETTDTLTTDVSKLIADFDRRIMHENRNKKNIKRIIYRIAACLIVLMAVGGSILLWQKRQTDFQPYAEVVQPIVAGYSKAIVLLSNGEKVNIEALADSLQFSIKELSVEKDSGILKYNAVAGKDSAYNTLIIPKGGEYQVELSDGTKVWLNADTKLKTPIAFTGNERRVFLSGEAYFDVTKDAAKPFIVETDMGDVQVYGTEFNVKNYVSDKQLKTTLVEGSIGFSNSRIAEIKLKPGYQLTLTEGETHPQIERVKVSNEISWKYKRFCFENMSLEAIAKDLERWYDVEIVFADPNLKKLEFSGNISRYSEITTLLHFFEESANIKFLIDKRIVSIGRK